MTTFSPTMPPGPPSIPPSLSPSTPTFTGISLGPSLRLISEGDILREFSPFGFNRRRLKNFLREIGVPSFHCPNGVVLIDFHTLLISMKGLTRHGQPSYHSPGSPQRLRGRLPRDATTSISASYLAEHRRTILREIHAAAITTSTPLSTSFRSQLRAAATRIAKANP